MKRTGILLIIICCYTVAQAQYPRFRALGVNQGLAVNAVNAIGQDSVGFIWIATQDGLQRYDGYTFTTWRYNPDDSTSLPSSYINDMYIHTDGKIWMAMRGEAICVLDPSINKIERYSPDGGLYKLSAWNATRVVGTNDNKVLVAYGDGMVDIIDLKTKKVSTLKPGNDENNTLCRAPILGIAIDKNNKWWFGSWGDGVCCYDPVTKKFQNFRDNTTIALANNTVRSVFCDSKNRIWVSNWNGGNTLIEQKPLRSYKSSDGQNSFSKFKAGLVWGFSEDARGNIWAATAEDGVIFYNHDKKIFRSLKGHPELPGTLAGNNVLCTYIDKQGIVWAGTWTGGISIFNPAKEFVYSYRHASNEPLSLPGNIVYTPSQSSNGNIWMGTGNGGVVRFEPSTGNFYPIKVSPQSEHQLNDRILVQAVVEDDNGNLWIGTAGTGLMQYNTKTEKIRIFHRDQKEITGEIQSTLVRDKQGNLWIGYNGEGIDVMDLKTYKVFNYKPSRDEGKLKGGIITAIRFDSKEDVWIGTYDGGLARLDRKTGLFKMYSYDKKNKTGISSDHVFSLHIDSHRQIWVGTSAGLNKMLPDGTFKKYTMANGLPNNVINGILEDNSGRLWLSTNNGVAVMDVTSEKFRVFGESDGFQLEYNQGAYYKLKDGRLLFGGSNGLNMIVPSRLQFTRGTPQVFFTALQVLNKPYKGLEKEISYLKEITLSYRDYLFSIDFASTGVANPDKTQYKYQLVGFDDDWVMLGNRNRVSFTNIDPGDYTLKVLATNDEGKWSKTPSRLLISITPPFWRTTWFYILCGVIIVLSAYGYLRLRERNLRKEKQILEEKVEKRTIELRHEKEKVEEAHREIKDSINYAKRIQESILPDDSEIKKVLTDFFILFHPKDVVSGDFFWHYRIPNTQRVLIAAADCTGHGVPGAFMSMIGNTLLNEIVIQNNQYQPNEILNQLHVGVRKALQQDRAYSDSRDGMDICLCHIDLDKKRVLYSGANRPLLILRNGAFIELNPDKMPIGGLQTEEKRLFSVKEEKLVSGDKLYLFSDGIIDQFGGDPSTSSGGKKFKLSRLREKLIEYSALTMPEQKLRMNDELQVWKGNYEQTDDICLIGISV